jgi:hypothetical protein
MAKRSLSRSTRISTKPSFGSGTSETSPLISEAAGLQAANAELGALIDEYESKHGRLTPDEVRAAHLPWQQRGRRRAA